MTTYNKTSSYNRTYEKKVIEETPRIRISTLPQSSPFTTLPTAHHILPVSVVDQSIVVEGKHPEKPDEFGSIERHFIRKFNLPRGVQPEGVSSSLTSDGTLTIQALPLRPKEGSPARAIPIKIVSGTSDSTAPPTQEGKIDERK